MPNHCIVLVAAVALTPAGSRATGSGREFVDPKRVAIVETKKVERPLAFVTVGQPGQKEAKVIDAYRVLVAGEPRAR